MKTETRRRPESLRMLDAGYGLWSPGCEWRGQDDLFQTHVRLEGRVECTEGSAVWCCDPSPDPTVQVQVSVRKLPFLRIRYLHSI